MPSTLQVIRERRKNRRRFGTLGRRGRTRTTTTPELRRQVAELTAYQQATGAPEVSEDKPGFLTRTIDVLSGFNYAIAGATEEMLRPGGNLGNAVGRFATELYSSARSLPLGGLLPEMGDPQKKAFGEVMEGLGYGTVTLGDAIPMLEGTFIGELVNTRGTLGLALDIVTDPTTYLTFGASAVARRTASRFAEFGIKKGANKKGMKFLQDAEAALRKETPGLTDEAYRMGAAKRMVDAGDDSLFDPGGVKFAGIAIAGMPGMPREAIERIGKTTVDAANGFGAGRKAVRTGQAMINAARGITETLGNLGSELFDPFLRMKGLSAAQKVEAERTMRKMPHDTALLKTRYLNRIDGGPIKEFFGGASEADIKRFVDGTQDGTFVPRNGLEEAASKDLRALFDEIGTEGVAAGIFDEAQIAANPFYMIHPYTNAALDEIPEVHLANTARSGKMLPGTKHSQSKVFDSLAQASEVTKRLERISRAARSKGIATEMWKELKPNYENYLESIYSYVDWFSKHKAMRTMTEELGEKFGFEVTERSKIALKFLGGASDYIDDTHPEWERVFSFFEGTGPGKGKRIPGLLGEADQAGGRAGAMAEVVADARKHLDSLKDEFAQRHFMHELFLRTNSLEQMDEIFAAFQDKLHLMPRAMTDLIEGTFEDALKKFGDAAVMRKVGGNGIWGKKEKLLPELIVRQVEDAHQNLFDPRNLKGMQKAFDGWHAINNWFKTSVYPIWPASQFRNAVSNVYLNGLRLGIHALNPESHKHSIMILAGKEGEFVAKNGRRYLYSEVRDELNRNGVIARIEDILERTGRGTRKIKKQKAPMKQIRQAIAFNENESRVMLAVQDLMDGLSFEEAAEDVAEFLFNYDEIAPIHRFIQNFVPFTTFTVKNIRAQVNALRRTPGTVATQLKPFRGRESENEQMVKFEAEGLKLRINKDGKTVTALTGIDLPMRNMDTIWAGGFGATGRRLMGMMTPLIKTPIEATANMDFFTGRKLDRSTSPTLGKLAENLPRPMQDWLGYKKEVDEAGRPKYTFDAVKYQVLVRSFVFSRIMSTSDRQFKEYVNDEGMSGILIDVLTGIRSKDLNLDEQQRRMLFARRRQLQESLVRRGVIEPPFAVYRKPDTTGIR